MPLYQNSVLKKYLKQQDKVVVAKAFKKFSKYFHDLKIQSNINASKEEEYQGIFLTEMFVKILGYTMKPNVNYDLVTEFKNEKNSKKADGAILRENKAIAVIELKGTNTNDLEKVRQQAFDYKANQTGCVYVITSNFEKIRFYINNAVDFEEFDLFNLNQERFELLYLCLAKDNILNNIPLKIKEASILEEEAITKKFYNDYSLFKRELFRDLVKLNMKNEVFRSELNSVDSERGIKNIKHALFKKSQKLIDRFLFIFFAEDRGLLPPNSTIKILDDWDDLKDKDAYFPLYERYMLYFKYLDQGRAGTDKKAEIFAYNGGLFKPDSVLNSLLISDDLLYKHTRILSNYDFESQVDVNILGHIFENSLNEIESVNAEIEGSNFDKQKTKRKKDGVFYTPKYITKYIIDNTVGKLCNEKKAGLNIIEEAFTPKRQKETKKKLLRSLDTYREWLLQLTILDPACGSGAFLNQALDFLIKEHQYLDELQAKLLGGSIVFPNIENTVLENNIFGVDLNEESVEIAKLSLWLRTAQPRRKLNDLSSNIKCGNSLIDDPKVAGDKAFNWPKEFPNIFRPKDKQAFHVVLTTHNSRTSRRMKQYRVVKGDPIELELSEEIALSKIIGQIIIESGYHCLAYNVCKDHVHLILVCTPEELTSQIQKIKSISSRLIKPYLKINRNIPIGRDSSMEHVPLKVTKEQLPSQPQGTHRKGDIPYTPFWSQKFFRVDMDVWTLVEFSNEPGYIYKDAHLYNALNYIKNNRKKHKLPSSKELAAIIDGMIVSQDDAFEISYSGGFDVVIGNPPYVPTELINDNDKNYLELSYHQHMGE